MLACIDELTEFLPLIGGLHGTTPLIIIVIARVQHRLYQASYSNQPCVCSGCMVLYFECLSTTSAYLMCRSHRAAGFWVSSLSSASTSMQCCGGHPEVVPGRPYRLRQVGMQHPMTAWDWQCIDAVLDGLSWSLCWLK